MMRLRQAAVIGTLFLLAWAATASAECAWVLWNESANLSAAATWTLVYAASSEKDCRAQAEQDYAQTKAEIRAFKELGHKDITIIDDDQRLAVGTAGAGGLFRSKFHCLPDTVDPRGARGK